MRPFKGAVERRVQFGLQRPDGVAQGQAVRPRDHVRRDPDAPEVAAHGREPASVVEDDRADGAPVFGIGQLLVECAGAAFDQGDGAGDIARRRVDVAAAAHVDQRRAHRRSGARGKAVVGRNGLVVLAESAAPNPDPAAVEAAGDGAGDRHRIRIGRGPADQEARRPGVPRRRDDDDPGLRRPPDGPEHAERLGCPRIAKAQVEDVDARRRARDGQAEVRLDRPLERAGHQAGRPGAAEDLQRDDVGALCDSRVQHGRDPASARRDAPGVRSVAVFIERIRIRHGHAAPAVIAAREIVPADHPSDREAVRLDDRGIVRVVGFACTDSAERAVRVIDAGVDNGDVDAGPVEPQLHLGRPRPDERRGHVDMCNKDRRRQDVDHPVDAAERFELRGRAVDQEGVRGGVVGVDHACPDVAYRCEGGRLAGRDGGGIGGERFGAAGGQGVRATIRGEVPALVRGGVPALVRFPGFAPREEEIEHGRAFEEKDGVAGGGIGRSRRIGRDREIVLIREIARHRQRARHREIARPLSVGRHGAEHSRGERADDEPSTARSNIGRMCEAGEAADRFLLDRDRHDVGSMGAHVGRNGRERSIGRTGPQPPITKTTNARPRVRATTAATHYVTIMSRSNGSSNTDPGDSAGETTPSIASSSSPIDCGRASACGCVRRPARRRPPEPGPRAARPSGRSSRPRPIRAPGASSACRARGHRRCTRSP